MNYYGMIKEFHVAFGLPVGEGVSGHRATIIKEERLELLKEACDYLYVVVGEGVERGLMWGDSDHTIVKDACKLLSISQETFNEAFKRVHESNMSKLDNDGKPVYREDGKVLKSENYKEAYLGDLL